MKIERKPEDNLPLQLFQLTRQANYAEAVQIAEQNIDLIFEHILDSDANEYISPLKYAFKVGDTCMWKLFRNLIQDDHPDLMDKFNEQLREQSETISLEPLYSAYEQLKQQYVEWLHSDGNADLSTFQKAQRKYLPAHILKEFCREDDKHLYPNFHFRDVRDSWTKSEFDSFVALYECRAYHPQTATWISLLPYHDDSALSKYGVLLRGEWQKCARLSCNISECCFVSSDLDRIRLLFTQRMDELTMLKAQLPELIPVKRLA